MASLFSKPAMPKPAAPPPQVDDANARLSDADRAARKVGRRTTVLTGDNGLPDLGATTKAAA